jgi:hypothetical protein
VTILNPILCRNYLGLTGDAKKAHIGSRLALQSPPVTLGSALCRGQHVLSAKHGSTAK